MYTVHDLILCRFTPRHRQTEWRRRMRDYDEEDIEDIGDAEDMQDMQETRGPRRQGRPRRFYRARQDYGRPRAFRRRRYTPPPYPQANGRGYRDTPKSWEDRGYDSDDQWSDEETANPHRTTNARREVGTTRKTKPIMKPQYKSVYTFIMLILYEYSLIYIYIYIYIYIRRYIG